MGPITGYIGKVIIDKILDIFVGNAGNTGPVEAKRYKHHANRNKPVTGTYAFPPRTEPGV